MSSTSPSHESATSAPSSSTPITQAPPPQPPLRRPPPPIPPPPRSKGRFVTLSLVALVTSFFALPFAYIRYHNTGDVTRRGHYTGQEAMTPTAGIRGAYLNSGSKDVGYDDAFYKRNAEVIMQLTEAQRRSSSAPSDDTKR